MTEEKTEKKEEKFEKEKPVSAKASSSALAFAKATAGEKAIEGKEKKSSSAKATEDKKETKKTKETDFKLDPEEMAQAGLHFGHRASRSHPKMKPYIFGIRNTIHIIDLEKTAEKFNEALNFIQSLFSEEKTLLLVGTKIQHRELVKELAKECNLPYVIERWIGGAFTNFKTISKRIEYFKELEDKKQKGELEKYTKKERLNMDLELKELEIKFGGIKEMKKLPDAVFVLDMKKDDIVVKEAKMKGIKTIAISDTNVDPTLVDYPIPANDDAMSSVKYILNKVKDVIIKAKAK